MKIILDTDIDTDCDDAGAIAILHHLAASDAAEMLGVVCSIPIRYCALTVLAINRWYGRQDIPVGLVSVPDWETDQCFEAYRAQRTAMVADPQSRIFNETLGRRYAAAHTERIEDAVRLYRRLLAGQSDNSVTICAIGTLRALAHLLTSSPDDISRLSGREIVARKVTKLISMAVAAFPEGQDFFNWRMDRPAAKLVLETWPTPIAVSGLGEKVMTGSRFMAIAPPDNPVSQVYEKYYRGRGNSGSSWDQLALLHAANQGAGLFTEKSGYAIAFDEHSGCHRWIQGHCGPPRGFITANVPDDDLARIVEDYMIASLRRHGS